MKCLCVILLFTLVSTSCAAGIDIDWSRVRPIEEFPHFKAAIPTPLKNRSGPSTPNRRVVNGQEATPGQFPYQVALLGEFELGIGLCGATIITNNYILTAAHCAYNSPDSTVPIPGGVVIVGAHNRMIEEPSQQRITFTSAGIIGHPGYTLTNIRHDIAVIRLDEPIVYTDRVQPVRLPARSDTRSFAGFIGTVSGFGIYDTANPRLSDVLNYAANPVMTNADCLDQWPPEFIEDQNICHSGDGGRGACNSDSGGPLTVPDGGSLQVGVVSFGAGGCDGGIPTVFMRVSYYLDWIEANSDFVADP
ncbi:AGAP002432-PA-like protein [Anopheles sinensis]|uniref:AGAP002432-PA-like protein n=1 Tax=Anopheles sinensis TaxID=74873 RepID=A0A084VQU7_ANOSI|nr:AGAP002432-PA-like protein [Anopheles sinensis]